MNGQLLIVVSSIVIVASCTEPPGKSADGGTHRSMLRADVDSKWKGKSGVPFDVDCSPLPYAKGAERDFCYGEGSWATLRLEAGTLVACSCGEFGGFMQWYAPSGALLQTLIAGANPQVLFTDGKTLLCVTGISHLDISEGAVHSFHRKAGRWSTGDSADLPSEAKDVVLEDDGVLLLSTRSGAKLRYRGGVLERVR